MIRRLRHICLVGTALLLATTAVAAAAGDPDRQSAASRINNLMRQNLREEALPLCRLYTAEFPGDAIMLYNLACLENTAGNENRAESAFAAALVAGFSEFEAAANDPDLQGPLHNVVVARSAAERERLGEMARSQALTLEWDVWSAPRDLAPHGPLPPADFAVPDAPQLRLRWREAGLELEVTATRGWAQAMSGAPRAPWNGGPGLFLSLCLPDGTSDWESANHFLFAFGRDTKGGVGGLFVASPGHWQPVAELLPKIKTDGQDHWRLTASIPWQAILPYGPVVDTPLGINATLIIPDDAFGRRASLVETTDTLNPLAPQRRFARLDFLTDSIDADQFVGRLGDSISRTEPLDLDLVAISATAGDATLSLNFIDQAGQSVLPEGPLTGKLQLNKGTNHLTRQADFRSLKAGGYVLQTELTFPSGTSRSWDAIVLHLPDDWQSRFSDRMALVAPTEQPTALHLLNTITSAVAGHQSRRNPGAIVASLTDLNRMLDGAEKNGTILPDRGGFVMVYPGPAGEDRLCRIYLPAGREQSDGLNPILLLGHGHGQELRLAARVGRNYEFGKQKPTLKAGDDNLFPVYIVPELRPDMSQLEAGLLAEAEACRRWTQTYFQTPAVSLVGIDALGITALQMAQRAPDACRALLVFAGTGLDPWPQAQPDFVRGQLGSPPPGLPVTWIDFQRPAGGASPSSIILQALKDLDYDIADEQKVRGGLNQTQVADRTVLWAEDLR